ncbi:hypothetical protein GCM10010489_03770 [Microbacterium saperdae]|nr:hypothetical protein GCM10010489_03770 [Microbacterium saperdae]
MRSRSCPTIFAEYDADTIDSTSAARAISASVGAPFDGAAGTGAPAIGRGAAAGAGGGGGACEDCGSDA